MEAIGCIDSHVYPAGIELFRQDSDPAHIYFVESGVAKLKRCEKNGNEFILDLRYSGSMLGTESAIRHKPHPFAAVTTTACRLSHISTPRFLNLIRTEELLNSFIQENLCAEVLNHAARMSEIASLSARQRREQLLWTIADANDENRTNDFKLQLPIKQGEVAQLLAITPTYLCRLLAELETDGIISRRNGWMILRNPAHLWHRVDF